ncbi:MAG: hypothetical protein LF885_05970 [Rickettsia endosymbiont of Culicoides impunctatus]|nr:MAG: hypothetical protein LF885_05970 [Rickettsia endosymbiont of Culicoides impunctatus]
MLHISQVLYKKEQSDAIKEGRPIKDFGEFAQHLNQHIYNDSIFAGKVHDNIVKISLKTQLVVEQKYAIIGGGQAKDNQPFAPNIPASNKPVAESAEFKWTEEGITKLLATNPANKITPPIPPLDIMVREQSLPTTSRTVAISDISVEESNIKNLSDDELRTAFR